MQTDIQLFFPQWPKKPLPFVPFGFPQRVLALFSWNPSETAPGKRQGEFNCCRLPADTINPLAANSPLLKKVDVYSWAPQGLSAVLLSLKVQGLTAAEHLSKYLLQFGGQIDKSITSEGSLSVSVLLLTH